MLYFVYQINQYNLKGVINMKNWNMPKVEELNISCTEQGKNVQEKFDEIRVDQNGNYWAGFGSGVDSNPDINGEVEVK